MNVLIEQGYIMDLQIVSIGSIKPVASGTFKNSNGEEIKYNASVQFKATNTELIEDEKLGEKEVETHIWIKIPCEHDNHVKQVNMFLRELKNSGEVVSIPITLPRQNDSDSYKATCTMNGIELIAHHKENYPHKAPIKKKEDK